MSRSSISYVGKVFGDLFIVNDCEGSLLKAFYDGRCICGRRVIMSREYLHKRGIKYKYVCKHEALPKPRSGLRPSVPSGDLYPTYKSWEGMKYRCLNPKSKDYPNYGGRGITVAPRWYVFENFLLDMGQRPDGTSLGRLDNNIGYSVDNCAWVTPKQQQNNTRYNVNIEGYSIEELAFKTGLTYNAIELRLRRGASLKDILETPKNHRMEKYLRPVDGDIGMRNGKLVVVEVNKRGNEVIYLCKCDCGNTKEVTRRNFTKTQSCGCIRSESAKRKKVTKPSSISQEYVSLPLFNSLNIGKKYSKLTIMEVRRKTLKPGVYRQYAKCKCDCGNETIVAMGNLTGNPQHTTSCGCIKEGAQGPKVAIIKEGDRFGKLLVLKARIEHSAYIATCKCDCGNPDDVKVAGAHLKYGRVVSCGCDGKNENVKVELRENKKKEAV